MKWNSTKGNSIRVPGLYVMRDPWHQPGVKAVGYIYNIENLDERDDLELYPWSEYAGPLDPDTLEPIK